jgi:hypothetical protein
MGNEAFSQVLIDKALEFSGWDLLNPKAVRFEFWAPTAGSITFSAASLACWLKLFRSDLIPLSFHTSPGLQRLTMRPPHVHRP